MLRSLGGPPPSFKFSRRSISHNSLASSLRDEGISEKFDGDLGGHLFQGPPDFLGGVCQPIRVNVNSNVAAPAAHMSALLEARDRLLQLMPALRTLEFDQVPVTHRAAR